MLDVKNWVNDAIEHISENLAIHSASNLLWGEVEMPEALKEKIEQNENLK